MRFFLPLFFMTHLASAENLSTVLCPQPENINFEEIDKAFTNEGFIVSEGDKKWKLSNSVEIAEKLDPLITTYLKRAEIWQNEGGFFKRSGKKMALAPVWAIAPDEGESPTKAFAPHLTTLIKLGLIKPSMNFKGAVDDHCVYKVDVELALKLFDLKYNFTQTPDAIFIRIK